MGRVPPPSGAQRNMAETTRLASAVRECPGGDGNTAWQAGPPETTELVSDHPGGRKAETKVSAVWVLLKAPSSPLPVSGVPQLWTHHSCLCLGYICKTLFPDKGMFTETGSWNLDISFGRAAVQRGHAGTLSQGISLLSLRWQTALGLDWTRGCPPCCLPETTPLKMP